MIEGQVILVTLIRDDGIVDEIAIDIAFHGFRPVSLTSLERDIAIGKMINTGFDKPEIARRLYLDYETARKAINRVEQNIRKYTVRVKYDETSTSWRVSDTDSPCLPKPGKPHEIMISQAQRRNGRIFNVRCKCMSGRNFRGCRIGQASSLTEARELWETHVRNEG